MGCTIDFFSCAITSFLQDTFSFHTYAYHESGLILEKIPLIFYFYCLPFHFFPIIPLSLFKYLIARSTNFHMYRFLNLTVSFQTESPLLIRPFLLDLTKSEIHAVMTGGFATIAGSVLGAYIIFGVSASHLLSASVMSAPAALALSKLMYPETEVPKTKDVDSIEIEKGLVFVILMLQTFTWSKYYILILVVISMPSSFHNSHSESVLF